MTPSTNTQSKEVEWKEQLGKSLKSLGLGMSGSQADFIFEHVESLISSTRQQVQRDMVAEIEKRRKEVNIFSSDTADRFVNDIISLLKETTK